MLFKHPGNEGSDECNEYHETICLDVQYFVVADNKISKIICLDRTDTDWHDDIQGVLVVQPYFRDNLNMWIQNQSLEDCRNSFRAICIALVSGLKCVHQTTFHGNLNPENIFFQWNKEAKEYQVTFTDPFHQISIHPNKFKATFPFPLGCEQHQLDIWCLGNILFDLIKNLGHQEFTFLRQFLEERILCVKESSMLLSTVDPLLHILQQNLSELKTCSVDTCKRFIFHPLLLTHGINYCVKCVNDQMKDFLIYAREEKIPFQSVKRRFSIETFSASNFQIQDEYYKCFYDSKNCKGDTLKEVIDAKGNINYICDGCWDTEENMVTWETCDLCYVDVLLDVDELKDTINLASSQAILVCCNDNCNDNRNDNCNDNKNGDKKYGKLSFCVFCIDKVVNPIPLNKENKSEILHELVEEHIHIGIKRKSVEKMQVYFNEMLPHWSKQLDERIGNLKDQTQMKEQLEKANTKSIFKR